jgi:hypothetical protein
VSGAVHFSAKALMKNSGNIADELAKTYAEPALVPESPWLAEGKPAASPPQATRETTDGKTILRVKATAGTRFVVVRALTGGAWATSVHGVAQDGTGTVPVPSAKRVVIAALDRTGRESEAVEVK